jgi:hypothetical protein
VAEIDVFNENQDNEIKTARMLPPQYIASPDFAIMRYKERTHEVSFEVNCRFLNWERSVARESRGTVEGMGEIKIAQKKNLLKI